MVVALISWLALCVGFVLGSAWCAREVERDRQERQARLRWIAQMMVAPRIPSAHPGPVVPAERLHPFDREAFGA